jgi:hypothetical protein
MTEPTGTNEPSGISVWSPKIANEALVRKFISLNGNGYIAIAIQDNTTGSQAVPVDPDEGSLAIAIWWNDVITNPAPSVSNTNPLGVQVLTVTTDSITRIDTGHYYYDLGPSLTANRGLITAIWTYTVNSIPFQFTDHLQVLDPMPFYDSLTFKEKSVVEQVSWMFGDLCDSTEGGPHLVEEFQTHWNYERIAQMMRIAVNRMNYIGNYGNKPTNWSVGTSVQEMISVAGREVTTTQVLPNGATTTTTYSTRPSFYGGNNIPDDFYGLVVIGTYLECMRHFRDSYTEIPDRPGMDVTYTNRIQYQQRWASNLQADLPEWEQWVKRAKLSLLNMSRGSLIVAGGIYGGSSGIFIPGQYQGSIKAWRMFNASPALMWNATHGNS